MSGVIECIFIASQSQCAQVSLDVVKLYAHLGIEGDRWYADESGQRGKNITLIAAEEIERYNELYHQCISYDATRRNVVTRNIDVNQLVGKTFSLGAALLRGVELCEPCRVLGKNLENNEITAVEVVKAFVHRGGLNADILVSGEIRVGDTIQVVSE